MKLIFSATATKALAQLPRKEAAALMSKLKQVAENPLGQYPWARKLTDRPGFRIRQGDWRAIYRLDRETGEMTVDRIAKRDEVYR